MTEEEMSFYRLARTNERDMIQNLNCRLQDYIEKVKCSSEQEDLEPRLEELIRNRDSDIENIKSNYAHNLLGARKTLDETAKEKAQCQLQSLSLKSQIERAEMNIARLKHENAETESKLRQVDAEAERAEQEKREAQNEREELDKKVRKLRAAIGAKWSQIDEVKLTRIDAQNKLQTQKEDTEFTRKLVQSETQHEEQLKNELIAHFAKSEAELQADIQLRMEQAIAELSARTDQDLMLYRDDVEGHFSEKKQSLEQDGDLLQERIEGVEKERRRLMHLQSSCDKQEASIRERMQVLSLRLEQQSENMEQDTLTHEAKRRELEEASSDIEQSYLRQIEELQGLLELRNGLDLEIETYNRLLNEEERRLSLKFHHKCHEGDRDASPDDPSTPPSTEYESPLVISCVEATGKFVEISNPSDCLVSLANHRIRNVAGDSEQVFKFHQRHRIAAGATMRVWTNCPESKHEPPGNFLWKKETAWNLTAGQVELINDEGNVISSFEKEAPQT